MTVGDFEQGYFDGYDRKPGQRQSQEYLEGYEVGSRVVQPDHFYHRTDASAGILANGFIDATGSYGIAGHTLTGVFISDIPLDINEGAKGDELLEVRIQASVDLREFELVQPRSPYREWCVPAELLNEHATLRLVDEE